MMSKYLVLKTWDDYDCGAPCAGIVNSTAYSSWQDAYDAIVKDILNDYGVSSLDEIEDDYELPDRNEVGGRTHKCGTAWISGCDGEVLYDIQTIEVK